MKDAIGAPVPRKEDLRLITGRGTYVSDLQPRRTQHVAFLRSPHAHARIGAVDVRAARELAGVRAVLTGEDFRDVTLRSGLVTEPDAYGLGAVWTDLDLDGDLDLYVANDTTPNLLYRNDGGRFTEIGSRAGVAYNEEGRS